MPRSSSKDQAAYTLTQIMTPIMAAALSALVAWVFKLDDRIFTLTSKVATREDVLRIEERLESLAEIVQDERGKARGRQSNPEQLGRGPAGEIGK
jgi:hypothetical protein